MPSVALDRVSRSANKDQLNLDLVLDGVALDERIEAAYAIVELGERKSAKEVGLPSSFSAEDEDLDIDENELYHQVPRSPDCLRECDRGACNRSAGVNPSRDAGTLLRNIGHVQGAVMPTRTMGNPTQKLTLKRRHGDDTIRGEIKAKLARMLIERKSSREETKKPSPGNGTCQKYSENDSDEDQVTESGRFVRTSIPILQSMSFASNIASTTNYKNLFENFQAKPEQFISAEERHNSLPESMINEQVVLLEGVDNQCQVLSQEISSRRRLEEVYHLKLNDASKYRKICTSEISSKNSASYNSSCLPDSSVLESEGELCLCESMAASNKEIDVLNSEIEKQSVEDRHCLLIRPDDHLTPASGAAGLLQYYLLPVIKTLPDSVKSDFHGVHPAVGGGADALKWLEHFSKGKGHYNEPVQKVFPRVSGTMQRNAGRKCQLSVSSNGIFGTLSDGALSEAAVPPLSGSIESLSLQNLSHIQRDSPKMANGYGQLRPQKCDVTANECKKSQSCQKKLMHSSTPIVETKMSNARRRISGISDALEMVKGGQFGSLRTLRNLYNRIKTRNTADSSTCLLQGNKLRIRAECRLLGSEEQEQELPLDLSWRHRKMSIQPLEVKLEADPCSLYLQSCEPFSSPDGCKQKTNDLSSKAAIENSTSGFDVLQMKADVTVGSGSDCSKDNRGADRQLDGLSSHSVPNSHLPPKKRKFIRLMSQNGDFSESKAPLSTKSTFPFQALSVELSTNHFSTKSCSGQTLKQQRTVSEAGAKMLTDVIANDDETILSAVAVRDEDGDLPLHIAVAQGCDDVVEKLLQAMSTTGLSVDSCNNNRQTALHLAVLSNQTQMVELLLKESASANVRDRKGNTAVHLAVKYKMLGCLRKILKHSRTFLDLDARNYEGLTALHIGVQLSQAEAVRVLLASGANPNATDGRSGRTPLFNAAEANDLVITSTLIQHGSDPYVASYSGSTPLQIAAGKSLGELVSIMENSGRECSRRVQDSN